MANIDTNDYGTFIPHGGTWGNKSVLVQDITLDAEAAIADVIRFAKMQANVRLLDAAVFTDTDVASGTIDFGYTSDSGDNDDPDHFLAAEAIGTAGRFRANTATPPVVVPEGFSLDLTVGGAAIPAGTVITVVVEYEFIGHD